MTLTPEKLDELEQLADAAAEVLCYRVGEVRDYVLYESVLQDLVHELDPATVRELVRLARERQWQPIETAPHETLVVLGWRDANGAWKQEIAMASAGLTPDIWRHPAATHWVPLPEPPEVPHD